MHDLRLLSAFAQAARSGSFTAAARVMRCSPGAISKNVARLEHDLGIRLFNRTTRQLSLTAEGIRFHEAISRSLAELERAEDIAATARTEVAGTVRLALGGAFGKAQVLPRLPLLLERHRALKLEAAFTDEGGDLVAGGYDLAVRCGAPDDSRYICRRLQSLPLVLVASPGHIATHGLPAHPDDLTAHPTINVLHGEAECGWRFTRPGAQAIEVHPDSRLLITAQVEAVVDAALAGLGATVIDRPAARPHLEAGRLVELLPDWEAQSAIKGGGDLFIVYPHRDYVPLRVRAVIEFLIEQFADHAGSGQ